jgi:hypothetical protein
MQNGVGPIKLILLKKVLRHRRKNAKKKIYKLQKGE